MARKKNWLLWLGLAAGAWWMMKGRTAQAAPALSTGFAGTYRDYFDYLGITTSGVNQNYDALHNAGLLDAPFNSAGNVVWIIDPNYNTATGQHI